MIMSGSDPDPCVRDIDAGVKQPGSHAYTDLSAGGCVLYRIVQDIFKRLGSLLCIVADGDGAFAVHIDPDVFLCCLCKNGADSLGNRIVQRAVFHV